MCSIIFIAMIDDDVQNRKCKLFSGLILYAAVLTNDLSSTQGPFGGDPDFEPMGTDLVLQIESSPCHQD